MQERGVDRITERVEDRRDFQIDVRLVLPDISYRNGNQLGKSAIGVYTDSPCICTKRTAAGHAITTSATDQMPLGADDIARLEIDHVRADIDDLTDKFVTDGSRNPDGLLCPVVPVINVEVRAANTPFLTRIRTSFMPISGSGTSSIQRPRSALLFTIAFIWSD